MKLSGFKFSIIILAHNSASGIEKTLNSLINQTLDFKENIEAIIVDDKSANSSEDICKRYIDKYPKNINFIQTSPIDKNIGLEKINGEYICFLENNDYLSKDTLKNVLNFIKKNQNADLIAIPLYYYKNGRKECYLDYKIKRSGNYNLLKQPEPAQLLSSSVFIKRKSIPSYFLNNYNEYLTFLNEILLNNPQLGVCKDGNYYMENIDEKLLPTEDFTLNSTQYDQFIEDNLNRLIGKSENAFSNIPKFIQYSLLNQLKWISSMKKAEEQLDFSKLKKITQYIDDEIILNNILIENDCKIFLFLLKYGDLNKELMEKLNLNTAFIDVYDIINEELNILGHIHNISKREVEVLVNGKNIQFKKLRFPQNDMCSLGFTYASDYSFEIRIPLSTNEKYEINFKADANTLNIDFSRPCNFSKSVGYAKTKRYISVYKDNQIIVKKKTGISWILQELKSEIKMIKKHEPGFIKAIPFRIAYMLGYPFLKNKKIWFYMDRPNESDDNGLHLFKYAVKQDDNNVKKYFILSSDSEDFDEVKKIGKVIPYKSLKHRFLGMFVENIITSHPDNGIIYPFWGGYPFFAGLLKSNNIFLQHGVLKDNISEWLNKSNMNLSFFLVSSPKEYNSIFNYPYNYDKEIVQLKGLPRFDNLRNIANKKQIIIMPSWRRDLTGKSNEYILETEYFKRFNSLINNEKLIEKAREYDYEIIFRPHPNVYNFIELYDENDYVKIDYEKTKFQTLFNNGSLMITDYSSVAFDFAYLQKPVIYYQYGNDYHFDIEESFFNYETMGFGEVCKSENKLVDLIIEYLENDCEIKEKYSKRIGDFFVFTDKNNCKRVHEAIKNIPLKD